MTHSHTSCDCRHFGIGAYLLAGNDGKLVIKAAHLLGVLSATVASRLLFYVLGFTIKFAITLENYAFQYRSLLDSTFCFI